MLTTAEEALPENPDGLAALEAAVNAVSQPQAQDVRRCPRWQRRSAARRITC